MKKFSSTTRGNYRRTSKTKTIRNVVLVGLVLALLIWLAPRIMASVAGVVLLPVHTVETWLLESSSSLPQFFRDRTELINEIATLRSLPPEGAPAEMTIRRLQQENEELRALLNDTSSDRILAGVIARPNVTPYDVLVIDKGIRDGVLVGAPVYVDDHTIIGSVKRVAETSAVVELVTTSGYRSTVYIYGPNIYTTAEGVGGGVLRVSVPQGVALTEGDVVVLPSASPGLFGEISLIESVPTKPEQFGYVQMSIPMQELHYVAVGTRSLTEIDFETAKLHVSETIDSIFIVPVPDDILIDPFATTSSSTISIPPEPPTTTAAISL